MNVKFDQKGDKDVEEACGKECLNEFDEYLMLTRMSHPLIQEVHEAYIADNK